MVSAEADISKRSIQIRLNWWFGLTYSSFKIVFNFFYLSSVIHFFPLYNYRIWRNVYSLIFPLSNANKKLKKLFLGTFLFFSFALYHFFHLHFITFSICTLCPQILLFNRLLRCRLFALLNCVQFVIVSPLKRSIFVVFDVPQIHQIVRVAHI